MLCLFFIFLSITSFSQLYIFSNLLWCMDRIAWLPKPFCNLPTISKRGDSIVWMLQFYCVRCKIDFDRGLGRRGAKRDTSVWEVLLIVLYRGLIVTLLQGRSFWEIIQGGLFYGVAHTDWTTAHVVFVSDLLFCALFLWYCLFCYALNLWYILFKKIEFCI